MATIEDFEAQYGDKGLGLRWDKDQGAIGAAAPIAIVPASVPIRVAGYSAHMLIEFNGEVWPFAAASFQ